MVLKEVNDQAQLSLEIKQLWSHLLATFLLYCQGLLEDKDSDLVCLWAESKAVLAVFHRLRKSLKENEAETLKHWSVLWLQVREKIISSSEQWVAF